MKSPIKTPLGVSSQFSSFSLIHPTNQFQKKAQKKLTKNERFLKNGEIEKSCDNAKCGKLQELHHAYKTQSQCTTLHLHFRQPYHSLLGQLCNRVFIILKLLHQHLTCVLVEYRRREADRRGRFAEFYWNSRQFQRTNGWVIDHL